MKSGLRRARTGIVAFAILVAGCGGGSSSQPSTTADPPATTTAVATTQGSTTTAATTTTGPATSTTTGATSTTTASNDDLVAAGKLLFEETAGGIGCAYCHGVDAMGITELASPDIRGMDFLQIADALATRAQMSTLVLSDDEIEAVAAYLQTFS